MQRLWAAALLTVAFALAACHRHSPTTPRAEEACCPDPWRTLPTPIEPPIVQDPLPLPNEVQARTAIDAVCPKVGHPYLYRVEKNGVAGHILGTRHISVSLSKMPSHVVALIDQASLVVFEVDPADQDDPSDTTAPIDVPKALGAKRWQKYRSLVGDRAALLRRASPPEAILTLLTLFEDTSAQLDQEIEERARTAGKPMAGLESAAFQAGLLAQLMDARALRATIDTTADRAEIRAEALDDIRDYCAGSDDSPGTDPQTRVELAAVGYTAAELDAIDERLVFARNVAWIPQLKERYRQPNVLVVVGADHLRGERGVVALLQKQGFQVERVPPSASPKPPQRARPGAH